MMTDFEWRHLRDPYGNLTGCFRWYYGEIPLCDHEHDEFDPICEDALSEKARYRGESILRNE